MRDRSPNGDAPNVGNVGPIATRRKRVRSAILRWYDRHQRDLPWRRTRDPYAIWISEIMLQQTRVEAVIPYYERFLARFPDVHSLSASREADVLAAWSGLGYYRRARNLRAGAQVLVREHAGRLPEDADALRRVPGIGPYTAGAIASVAFDKPVAAVDGNVIRVLARIEGLQGRRDAARLRKEISNRADALAYGPRPRDWTQALMELGATLCRPRDPLCPRCPARALCAAHLRGSPDEFPEPAKASRIERVHRVLLLARAGEKVLLKRSPTSATDTSHWTLPLAEAGKDAAKAARDLAQGLGLPANVRGPVARFRHVTFAEHVIYELWETAASEPLRKIPSARWVFTRSIRSLPVRSPTLKAIGRLRGVKQGGTRRESC